MTKKRDRPDPAPVGSSKGARDLASWYEENGESEHVAKLEGALTTVPRTTKKVAEAAGVSTGYATRGLDYLALRGRAERHHEYWQAKPFQRAVLRYLWCLPSESQSLPDE